MDDKFNTMMEIVLRAEDLGIMLFSRISLHKDLKIADEEFNLRLDDLLNADDHNFAHDIIGIQHNIDRLEGKMVGFFLPRYASMQIE